MDFFLFTHLSESVLLTQLCLTLCEPMDCSPPGSCVHGILQARVLEWGCHAFLQKIFLTQGLILGLLHCKQSLYNLIYWGKLKEQIYWEAVSTNWECIWISLPPVTFPGGAGDKEPDCQCRRHERHEFNPWVRKIFWRKAWQPHSSIPAWRILWTEDPGWLQSMVLQRVGHDWNNWAQYSHIPYFCQSLLLKIPIKTQVTTRSRLTWERSLPPFSSSSTLWSYSVIITFSLKHTWLSGAPRTLVHL